MNIIIAGCRDFTDYEFLKFSCEQVITSLNPQDKVAIVSGCARGADQLGERFAKEKGFEILKYPANWHEHGKAAGPMRNSEMANAGHVLIAFPIGESKGTRDMISKARAKNLRVFVFET